MYFSKWFYVIGSHLLILAHITNSLVLLTANVEDIRKIAQKFISESLADKLTDLIVKATAKADIDVSEENKQNNIYHISKDNWRNKHKKTQGIKDKYKPIKPGKVRNYETTNYETLKDTNVYNSREIKKTRYNLQSSRDTAKEYINQNPYIDENVDLKARREPTILSNKNDLFESINKDEHEDYMNSINEIRNRVFTASTKKEKNEFDQYNNSNYPKAGIIATSGGVALTKGPDDSYTSIDNKDYK
ncbi:unnamed protein product [Colias eurytheme]|nr:unnamed protein product [Colias eurytheme]